MYLCRIAGYSATQNKIDIRPVYAVNNSADWIYSTNEDMLTGYWKPIEGHIFVSVNSFFSQLLAHPVTVSPIGRVFRK